MDRQMRNQNPMENQQKKGTKENLLTTIKDNLTGLGNKLGLNRLTRNEKILLSVLGAALILFLVINFILIPQSKRINDLEAERLEYEEEVNEMNRIIAMEPKIIEQWEDMTIEKVRITSKYFPTLDQAQIIYLLSEVVENEEVSIDEMIFSEPELETMGDFEVMSMNISMPYSGTYDGAGQVIGSIDTSPRKILVDYLSLEREGQNNLDGSVDLKIYSLEGISEVDRDFMHIDQGNIGKKVSPFVGYDGYIARESSQESSGSSSQSGSSIITDSGSDGGSIEVGSSDIDYDSGFGSIIRDGIGSGSSSDFSSGSGFGSSPGSSSIIDDSTGKSIILDFEKNNLDFIPSQSLVKGNVSRSNNAKTGKYSLRLEYDIIALEEENRAYIDLSKNKLNLQYPPSSIGIWLNSYGPSPATVGLGFKGQMGEEEYIPLTEGIGWRGWRYLEISPPDDLDIYPLEIDKLYLELPDGRDDKGVILLDSLGVEYAEEGMGEDETGYIFHTVKRGETPKRISIAYYGHRNKAAEIMKLNDIKSEGSLPVGKILILKKP